MKTVPVMIGIAAMTLVWATQSMGQSAPDGRFSMARIRYSGGGDWYGNETSWSNLLTALGTRTTLECLRKESTVSLQNNEIFQHPFVTLSGHGQVTFSADEAQRLRQYLIGGGFLWIDDDFGMDEFIRVQLKKVFPTNDLVELPRDHGIYHSFYDLKQGLPKVHEHHGGSPHGYGLFHEGRMVLFYSFNTDIGDGLEDADVHKDPPGRREEALQMAINVVMYALTH